MNHFPFSVVSKGKWAGGCVSVSEDCNSALMGSACGHPVYIQMVSRQREARRGALPSAAWQLCEWVALPVMGPARGLWLQSEEAEGLIIKCPSQRSGSSHTEQADLIQRCPSALEINELLLLALTCSYLFSSSPHSLYLLPSFSHLGFFSLCPSILSLPHSHSVPLSFPLTQKDRLVWVRRDGKGRKDGWRRESYISFTLSFSPWRCYCLWSLSPKTAALNKIVPILPQLWLSALTHTVSREDDRCSWLRTFLCYDGDLLLGSTAALDSSITGLSSFTACCCCLWIPV